jgi:two-component system, LytTR family, sensor kinase
MRWWLWSIAGWLAFGVLDGTQVVVGMRAEGMHHAWWNLFALYALSWAVWALVSPLVLMLGQRFPPARRWPVHIASYIAIGVVHGAWIVWLELMLQPMGPFDSGFSVFNLVLSFFYSKSHLDLIAYAGLLALAHTLESRRTLAERDEQLAQARFDALRRQLEPHFLFNTLNGIAGLVRGGKNDTAVNMIAGLSDLLRRAVDGSGGMETSLAEEVEFLEKYLEIQQMRFASRLRVEVNVPGELLGSRVPGMILQPMVENAIEHGIGMRVEGGLIRIAASRVNGSLRMSVENDGPPLRAIREGVGIANTRARLKSLYGDGAAFDIHNNGAGLVEAVVTVPYGLFQ